MATATLIDRDNQYAYGVNSMTLTGITWTAGDEYIVVTGGGSFGGTMTVSDAGSGTWAQILNQTEAYGEMWIHRLSGGSPSGDISIAFSGGGIAIPHAHLYRVSPDSGSLTYEAVVGYNAIGAGTGATPRPVDASAAGADNLVLAVGWISASGNAFTSNWTKLSDDFFDNNNRGIVGAYKADGGGETATFLFDPTRPNWMAAGVEISESGATPVTLTLPSAITLGVDPGDALGTATEGVTLTLPQAIEIGLDPQALAGLGPQGNVTLTLPEAITLGLDLTQVTVKVPDPVPVFRSTRVCSL